jgi:hypothetical protein
MKICEICGLSFNKLINVKYSSECRKSICSGCKRKKYTDNRRLKYANLSETELQILKEKAKPYRIENKDSISKQKKSRYLENIDTILIKSRELYTKRRELDKITKKNYYEQNKDVLLHEMKKYQKDNKDSIIQTKRKYYLENKEKIREHNRTYRVNRRKIDPAYKMKQLLKSRLWGAMKLQSKNGKTKSCKEYGINFDSIYRTIGPRPSNEYELDHIIPLNSFNLDNSEHVRLAHLPCNLRWITKKDNMIKSSKIPESAYYYPPLWEILVEIGVIE